MRIGIDARMYGPEATTGIGVYIKNLTDHLFLIDQKNEYVLFMLDPAYSQFQPPNPRIKKVKVDCPWYSWSEQQSLPGILLKHKLDLVHFPHFNVPIFYPKKFVVTIHDITPKFFPGPQVKKSLIRKLGYQIVFRTALKRAEKIITVSDHTKKNLDKFFNAPANKIQTIHIGFNSDLKPITEQNVIQDLKNKYQITKPFIFYVGVWRDHKNLPGLINAFNILKSEYRLDYQLVLAGKQDPKYPEIKQTIANSPFESDIILPGYVSDSELPLFYNAAKLFVLPSFCEGFGLVALESMACHTPVIGSKTTSLPEILEDAALYFDPKNPKEIAGIINKVLTDDNLYQNLQKQGLEQIKKYSWQDCAKKTLMIYSRILP